MKKILFVITLVCVLATLFVAIPVAASPSRNRPSAIWIDTNNPPPFRVPTIGSPGPSLEYISITFRDGRVETIYPGPPSP